MRRRIGNDLTIKWTITNKGGSPYNLEGKDISLIYSTSRTKTRVREFSVSGNVITWVFYGLEQKECGTYTLTLIENENEVGMVTLDSCQAFTLVPLSCMENDYDTGVDVESLELESSVNLGQLETLSWGSITGKPSNFADWNAEEGSEKFISNKPVIPTKTSDLSNDSGFITSIPADYVTETELQAKKYATKTELEQGLEGKQPVGDYLTEESDPTVPSWAKQPNKPTYTADEVGAIAKGGLKTINGQSIEGSGNIEIQGGGGGIADAPSDGKQYARQNGSWTEVEKTDISGLATKEELNAKADVSDIPTKVSQLQNDSNFLTSVPENYVTEEELSGKGYATQDDLDSKQDTLVSGTNIKTINGQSLLGEGNLEIQGGTGGGISDAPADGKKYVRSNNNWVEETKVDTSTFATKEELEGKVDDSEIADMLTKTEAASTYQPKGDYALKSELPDTSNLATKQELAGKLDIETYNTDKAEFATKEELGGYVTTESAETTYAKKTDIPEEYNLPIATADTLGGVKVGAGLSIDPETGALSATGGGTADSVDWANVTSKPDFKAVATSGSYNDLTDKPTIPTNTSELTNDSGFLTAIPDEYVTESELEEKGYATKAEIPTNVSQFTNDSGYLTDANSDGKSYARKDGAWVEVASEAEVAIQETTPSEANEEKLVFEVNEEEEGLYVDEDAPADGNYYARKDNSWQKVVAESVPEVSIGETDPTPSAEEKVFYKVEETEEESPIYITEAPKDDKIYGRKNGAWVEAGGAVSLEEVVNITLTTDQSTHEALNGSEIHLKYSDVDKVLTWQGSTLTEKVPLAVQYTIEFPEVEGYKKPSNVSYLAVAGNVRSVDVVYKKNVINIIHIDQTISDPDSMVTGDVNGEVIQWIRQNSHRVLAKKTAEGEMAYYPLDDTNSNKYADGSPAKLDGTEGDVMLMLPTFYYKGTEGDQVDLMFSREAFDDAIEWDRNILIGVYESVMSGNKAYSKSGVVSTGGVSQANWKSYATARGQGYQLVDWQMHCVLGCLYYAMYGNTDSQGTIGKGTNSYQKINGETNALGMTDTVAGGNGDSGSINFWGLENWWGNKYEWMQEDNIGANMSTYDPITKGSRNVAIPDYQGKYPKKMVFGKYLDLIARSDDPKDGTNSTGYCDYQYWDKASTARVVRRSSDSSSTDGGVACANARYDFSYTNSSNGSRLAFRGTCTQSESVETFKSLPITN